MYNTLYPPKVADFAKIISYVIYIYTMLIGPLPNKDLSSIKGCEPIIKFKKLSCKLCNADL